MQLCIKKLFKKIIAREDLIKNLSMVYFHTVHLSVFQIYPIYTVK